MTGATGGIGHAIARALHAQGVALVLTGRRSEVLAPLAEETGARALSCDLADRQAVRDLARECADVDILVANAALPASGRLEEFDEESLDAALEVNLRAPMQLTLALLDGWRVRERGHAVYISSISGKIATAGSSVYAATKFGLRGFAQGMRDELHGSGIGMSSVNPGFIRDAGMFADSGVVLPKTIGTNSPEDVAKAVVRAVRDDRGDLDVAPALIRFSAKLNALAPDLTAGFSRRMGSGDIGAQIAAGQRARD